ncbi:hypothetical protein BC829DRAFT_487671 [Chytridium lagenaria]|nr:hypothetical protein BC829DRAFT_487671 [Chytridium lagenaria]
MFKLLATASLFATAVVAGGGKNGKAPIAMPAPAPSRAPMPPAPMPPTTSSGDKIIFDKKDLTIEDSTLGAELSVRLSEPPSDVATVYLEVPGLQITNCALKFNKDNWKNPQKYSLNAQVFSPNSGVHLAKKSIEVTRRALPPARCQSSGDPHYRTFDGKYYSAQGRGVYYLVKSPSLIVQADQMACGKRASCNKAVAIQFGPSVITITAAKKSRKALQMNLLSKGCDNLKINANKDKSQYQVRAADGTLVTTDGLCGNYNGKPEDDGLDIKLPVPPVSSVCKIPDLGSPAPPSTGVNTDCEAVPGWSPITVNVPSPTAIQDFIDSTVDFAAEKVEEALKKPFCAKIIDLDFFVGACSADLANTGDTTVVTNAQLSYLSACSSSCMFRAGFAVGNDSKVFADKAAEIDAKIAQIAQVNAGWK